MQRNAIKKLRVTGCQADSKNPEFDLVILKTLNFSIFGRNTPEKSATSKCRDISDCQIPKFSSTMDIFIIGVILLLFLIALPSQF